MSKLNNLIDEFVEAALSPSEAIEKSKQITGKEIVGCFPVYTPEEIIYAAGFLPVGMWGGKTEIRYADKYLQSFCCSIMRSNIEYGIKGVYKSLKATIIPAFCDTLKCIIENWKVAIPDIPVIPVVYPQNRTDTFGYAYLVAEFTRFKSEMEKLSGKTISESELAAAFDIYENYRSLMRSFVEIVKDYPVTINARKRHLIIKSGYFMDKKHYSELMKELIDALKAMPKEKHSGPRVVGTGLIFEPIELTDIFVENQISLVEDDFAQESRQFRAVARTEGTAMDKMAYRVVDLRGCTFLYEEQKSKGDMLVEMVKRNKADAVFVSMMKFCDPEEFDYPIIKKKLDDAGIPILYIETEMHMDSYEQIRTRIQSFSEMLM
ncbi:MAG: (R)-2-hydroxyisocaproyl-CoA dehydratase beta subunit [Clostridiales bacterium]|jgi:bcr-type benzoyl-CoA reductase subunit C|nr:(R)-2-hydroxyisocaproyl-CoA dehydratase beta subunit [Clostridiales bacterium]